MLANLGDSRILDKFKSAVELHRHTTRILPKWED